MLKRDEGSSLIIVLVWSMGLLLLALVVSQAAINAIVPSDRSEKSYAALAAAEAGIDDYRARLLVDNRYFLRGPDATNPALTGWAQIPGGDGIGEYTYSVDATRALNAGELRIISTGRVGDVTRTVEAVLTKRSTLDYVYISDIETMAPYLPGAYSDQTLANQLCTDRMWKDAGQVSKSGVSPLNGIHRNSNFCRWAGIFSTERLKGRVHTNDVWYLANNIPNIDPLATGGNTSAVFDGKVTTSCPLPTASTAGCPANMRWIDTNSVSSNSAGTWSTSTTYKLNELSGSYPNKLWNPQYDTVLEIPASNSRMKELATSGGCVFTGPTRIRFRPNGNMEVTSPDTKQTSNLCGGSSLYADPTNPTNQPTAVLNLQTMTTNGFNGVVYVQGTAAPLPSDPNYWAPGVESATCKKKTVNAVNSYPFVIPKLEANDVFQSGYTGLRGFPSEKYGSAPDWYDCTSGDVFIQGEYQGAVTIAADNNIALTGHVVDTSVTNKTNNAASDYGRPPLTSNNMVGLVPTRFLYAYRPLNSSGVETADWDYTKAKNVIYNFAAVVLTQCFGAQDATKGVNMGGIYLRGSLGQKYRCPVGLQGGSGYQKYYEHDQRFAVEDPPPYMLELSNEPWKVKAYSETTIRRDSVAQSGTSPDSGSQTRSTTKTWNVLANDSANLTLIGAQIASGGGTATVTNGQISFTAPGTPGQTVVHYIVMKPDGTKVAQSLTITVT